MQDVIVWDIDQRGMNCTKWSDILEIRIVRSIADAEYMTKKYEDDFRHNRTINETFKDEGNRIIGYYRFATSWRLSTLPQVIKYIHTYIHIYIYIYIGTNITLQVIGYSSLERNTQQAHLENS